MNQNELPNDYKIEDIFFGDDDRKALDFSKGRPSKDKDDKPITSEQNKKVEVVSGSKHSAIQKKLEQQEDLIKQAKFLRKFEERVIKQEITEKKYKKVNAIRRKQKRQVKAQQKKRTPVTVQATRDHLQDLVGCEHEDKFDFFDGQIVRTRCIHCSRERVLSPQEWRKANPYEQTAVNPNPELFSF